MTEVRYAGVTVGRAALLRDRSPDGAFLVFGEPLPVGTPIVLKMEDREQMARVTEVIESADPNSAGMRLRFGAATSTVPSRVEPAPLQPAAPATTQAPGPPATSAQVPAEVAPQVAAEPAPEVAAEAAPEVAAPGQATSASEPGDQGGHSRRRRRRR